MPVTCSPYFFYWKCNHNDTEIRTNLASASNLNSLFEMRLKSVT